RADSTFEAVPQIQPAAPPSRFPNARGYLVHLSTQARTREDKNPVPKKGLAPRAPPLQHLAWPIEDPGRTSALWGSGVLVNIPQPAKFAVHKLILAQRRDSTGQMKRSKDLAQAKALIEALTDSDPFSLEDAMTDAIAQGRNGWRQPIMRSLIEIKMET